ncbi:MAG: tRNA (guanosine(37)-N1)-methyltransferase TrmD, partial [Lachnospiraceae bacterium]|nr:tRNA (guanosine(37)-N1)-methyltransferase TrmD [Lachnospiraceae bacterium]
VDDYPYGGGRGMLMQAEPVVSCCRAIQEKLEKKARVLYMSPQGRVFDQAFARELAEEENLILLCGHYEGIDERAVELCVTDEVSIGDFVLTGGELPALVVIDAVSRMVPGVLKEGSAEEESFSDGLLEYPQYTRPEEFMGKRVPEILLSGHHENVEKWRRKKQLERTFYRRPELLRGKELPKEDRKFLASLREESEGVKKDPDTDADAPERGR